MREYADRKAAGTALAEVLVAYEGRDNAVVLGLPRGGVPVAAQVADRLKLPLDVVLVAKLGVPGQRELAFGAVAFGAEPVFNSDILAHVMVPAQAIEEILAEKRDLLEERNRLYRGGGPALNLSGKTILLVDDGLATGATMKAAVLASQAAGAKAVIIAVPVGSTEACAALRPMCNELVCLMTPVPFWGVGHWYQNFDQTPDTEVVDLLCERP